jgi:hypothetical protein
MSFLHRSPPETNTLSTINSLCFFSSRGISPSGQTIHKKTIYNILVMNRSILPIWASSYWQWQFNHLVLSLFGLSLFRLVSILMVKLDATSALIQHRWICFACKGTSLSASVVDQAKSWILAVTNFNNWMKIRQLLFWVEF